MPVSAVRAESYDQKVVAEAFQQAFALLGLPPDNPFRNLANPGDQVFIKPNWVAHSYRASCSKQFDVFTTITHPAVIREVARWVDRALQGKGKILIGDNPSIDADFSKLMEVQALQDLENEFQTPVEFLDLRPLVCTDLRHYGQRDKMTHQKGDPAGETIINLGRKSQLYGLNPRLFRGVFNEREETINAHTGTRHLYGFSNSIYRSDLFISIPKLKTHHKVGVTLNLKGLVGAIGTKNYLVHWQEGFPAVAGDAYPNFRLWLKDRFKKVKKRGAWSGNDTIWRMVVDLHEGMMRGPKKFFSVIDGILGGEGNGPFCPEPNESKTLIVGTDLLYTDIVASRLMGFNPEEIPYLRYYLREAATQLKELRFLSDFIEVSSLFDIDKHHLDYKPPTNWQCLVDN